ncbi:MAG: hypothetical protein ACR2FS_09280 [Phormidesmis sp.]
MTKAIADTMPGRALLGLQNIRYSPSLSGEPAREDDRAADADWDFVLLRPDVIAQG